MTVQELKEFILARFDAQDKRIDAQGKQMDARFDAQDKRIDARFDAQDKRLDGMETRQGRLEDKFDRVMEEIAGLRSDIAFLRGERAFSTRFWKHAAWITPTAIALAALIKSVSG